MYVLGGSTNPTQIAVVEGCGVVSAGELTEPVDGGLCTTFYDEDEHAIICSPTTKSRACLNFTPEEGFKPGDNKKEYPDTEEQHHGGAIVLSEGIELKILNANFTFERNANDHCWWTNVEDRAIREEQGWHWTKQGQLHLDQQSRLARYS